MIEKSAGYKSGQRWFATLEEAQKHELETVFDESGIPPTTIPSVAQWLMMKQDLVLDILTITPASKPKARSLHGGRKKRTPKTLTETETKTAA